MIEAVIEVDGDWIYVRPTLGKLQEVHDELGAAWDSQRSAWKIARARHNVVALEAMLPDVSWPDEPLARSEEVSVADARLLPYQPAAVERLLAHPRGQLLAMSPGLGKTVVAIIAADMATSDQVIVVSPGSLVRNWRREIERWSSDPSVVILDGAKRLSDAAEARWIIITWDLIARHTDWFEGERWPLMILDESVLMKSRRTHRFKALAGGRTKKKTWRGLRRDVDRVWLLSGSPTTRHADDLWSQLNLIWPRAFPSYWRFAERYCVVEETVWGKNVVADRRRADPLGDNSDLIYVVSQEDVLDLPEYLFEVIDVDLTPKQRRAYSTMEAEFLAELKDDVVIATNELSKMIRLQQIVAEWEGESAKHDALLELIQAYEPPYLIWTHWRDSAARLAERLGMIIETRHVHGGLSDTQKDAHIEAFKADGGALVLSLGVGKFGHTMTDVRTVFYLDKTWNADDYFQSLHRVRRYGLKHSPVVVTIRAPGTIDELVETNLEGKLPTIGKMTGADLKAHLRGLGR